MEIGKKYVIKDNNFIDLSHEDYIGEECTLIGVIDNWLILWFEYMPECYPHIVGMADVGQCELVE